MEWMIAPAEKAEIDVREPKPGDLGWVVARHAELYAQEYRLGGQLRGRVRADRCRLRQQIRSASASAAGSSKWMARMSAAVFLVKDSDRPVARLRLLLVDPVARGRGLGTRLTDECVGFARRAGYARSRSGPTAC